MKNRLFVIILSLTFSLYAQNENDCLIYRDSIEEIYAVNNISIENFHTLKVCFDAWSCKGFITEKDATNTTEIDVRAVISRIANHKFKIEYKYRDSEQFICDTFNIFCLNGSFSIALPYQSLNSDFASIDTEGWFFMPASTDERDVVYIKTEGEKIIIYQKN